jgi:hypothetical protein
MLSWLKEMGKQWVLCIYALVSFVSTVATYSRAFVPGHVGIVVGISSVVAFVAAAVRVDLRRQKEIRHLGERLGQLQTQPARKAQLIIHPGNKSKYIVLRANDQHPLPPRGLHIELELSIENKGNRSSSIKQFGLCLPDFQKSYPAIRPYFTNSVKGRTTNFSLGSGQNHWGADDFIRVDSEAVAGPKLLSFEILSLPLGSFGERAFEGDRETRIFPSIRCELTLTDTEGSCASHEFLLGEAW